MSAEPLPTPFVAVDRARLLANIDAMATHARDLGMVLRPHAKTHKSAAIARRQVQAGAVGLTVATVGEAEAFARYGFDDLFIAFPLWADADRAHRLGHLLEQASVRVGVDSDESVAQLKPLAGERLSVLIEIDSGHRRSGVEPADAGRVAAAAAAAGLRVEGVFTFPGHAYAASGRRAAAAEAKALADAADAVHRVGLSCDVVSGGSTPSAPAMSAGVLTEARPGVYVFGDAQQVALGSTTVDRVALHVHATVVSQAGGRVVLDAGSKVLGPESPDYVTGFGLLPEHPQAQILRLSEHHAVLDWAGHLPGVGSQVRIVPNHVCLTVNMVDTLIVLDDGTPSDTWPVIARGANT
jgi:D-serine deaminase-like pyridoxal phosphate-dependent protein